MSKLLELAERCEKAQGPDEQLERDIALVVYGSFFEGIARHVPTQEGLIFPRYTASIDAAMTLLPQWSTGEIFRFGPGAYVTVQFPGGQADTRARTLPLAICASALAARASQEDQSLTVGGVG